MYKTFVVVAALAICSTLAAPKPSATVVAAAPLAAAPVAVAPAVVTAQSSQVIARNYNALAAPVVAAAAPFAVRAAPYIAPAAPLALRSAPLVAGAALASPYYAAPSYVI